jgi:hypothetical protein
MILTEIIKNEFKDRISIISFTVSMIALLVMIITLSETNLPLLSDFGSAFLILFIIGFVMSALSGARDNSEGEFTMPKTMWLPLAILGALSFLLLIMGIFNIQFLIINTHADRFVVLSLMIIAKWVYVHSYNVSLLLKAE